MALRCLYDIVEANHDFDVVVWSSLKTTSLTTAGVRSIAGALTNELQLLQAIAATVGPDPGQLDKSALIELVIALLAECRVLLAIDNMETIDREALRPLFAGVPRGSRILLTSRVGIGEFENRYALQGLLARDAIDLIRRTARLYNVPALAQREDKEVEQLAAALFRNPLAIRWFVQGYSEGRPIQDLLSKRGSLQQVLEFCFHTLYESLDEPQKTVLRTFVATGKPLSEVQLALLTETWDVENVRTVIQYLYSSNLLMRSQDDWHAGESTLWTTTPFARDYILGRDRQVASERLRLQSKYKALIVARDQARADAANNLFNVGTITFRSTDQAMVVRLLSEALKEARARNVRAAADLLSRAAALQPEFYEVWRVSAYAKERSGDILGAQVDFARAVELADGESEPLLVHYAHFLRRQEDFSAAVEILKDRALREDASPALVAAYGWMLALSGDPESAVQQYDRIKGELLRFGFDGQRQLLTQYIEVMRREAEVRQRQNRYEDALRLLQRALAIAADAIGFGLLDAQLVRLAQDCASMSFSCLARRYDEQSWVSISQMLVAMCMEFEVVPEAKRGYLEALGAAQPAIKADPAYVALSRPIESSQLLFGSALTPFPRLHIYQERRRSGLLL